MTEVKFACPQCNRHIACDADFAGIRIECPECGQVMLVPLLRIASDAQTRPVVAAKPPPKRLSARQTPGTGYWTEKEWAEHYRNTTGETLREIPVVVYVLAALFLLPVLCIGFLFLGCTTACH